MDQPTGSHIDDLSLRVSSAAPATTPKRPSEQWCAGGIAGVALGTRNPFAPETLEVLRALGVCPTKARRLLTGLSILRAGAKLAEMSARRFLDSSHSDIVMARFSTMLAMRLAGLSLPEIAHCMRMRSHKSVVYGLGKANANESAKARAVATLEALWPRPTAQEAA